MRENKLSRKKEEKGRNSWVCQNPLSGFPCPYRFQMKQSDFKISSFTDFGSFAFPTGIQRNSDRFPQKQLAFTTSTIKQRNEGPLSNPRVRL